MTEADDVSRSAALWLKRHSGPGACISVNSRAVRPGDVFAALKGVHADGLSFAPDAVARGAASVICEKRPGGVKAGLPVPVLEVEGLPARLGRIASAFHDDPSGCMSGIGITGTNGKTTTSHWTAMLLGRLHHPAAAIGTIGCFYQGKPFRESSLTTPDAASLQALFADLYSRGCQAFAVETSSIGLVQGRLNGTAFRTAVFTNLTRDHLDYHRTMEAYEDAKRILFEWPGLECAVVNADDPAGLRLARLALGRGVRTIACTLDEKSAGIPAGAEVIAASGISFSGRGMAFSASWEGEEYRVESGVLGRFNVSNLLASAGAVLSLGINPAPVFRRLEELEPPAGRMQVETQECCPLAVVDYSHTPDALEKALSTLREVAAARGGRLWAVFGAGGGRDHGKRPLMGAVAAAGAERIIVTSDNPRNEDPAAIAADILAGIPQGAECEAVLDRRAAITRAVIEAGERDVILVAGKGHENYQEGASGRIRFLDAEVVREALELRRRDGRER